MNRSLARFILLAVMSGLLAGLLCAGAAAEQGYYVIPDSDTRLLTREEVRTYRYDTLFYAYNEIYARHGYKFEKGSRCWEWFSKMPWYRPNENESATDHRETFDRCSETETANRDLIIEVRREMRAEGNLNPDGIGMPEIPDESTGLTWKFEQVSLKSGQKLAVFSAPSRKAYRANKGKATVSTKGAVYALGYDSKWMLMLYEANQAGQYRVGYIECSKIKGKLPELDELSWDSVPATLTEGTDLTDDPVKTGNAIARLEEGTQVTFLATMFSNPSWDYIETKVGGKVARGFILSGKLAFGQEE